MAKPCAGKNTHSPCFNYMESNIAGMSGIVSLLNSGGEGLGMGGGVLGPQLYDC